MKAHEARALPEEELNTRLTQLHEELFRTRCNAAVGQLDNANDLRRLRREIARAKTILHEKKRDAASGSTETPDA